jgi:anti-sigma B factor antagonist
MTIQSEKTGASSLVLSITGRLDTNSAPFLEKKLQQCEGDITELSLDFLKLTYISSLGLRVILHTQKSMKEQGKTLLIKNMSPYIREIFEMSGLINLMENDEKPQIIDENTASPGT